MGNITPKDYTQILSKGLESSLASTPIEDGKIRYCTDTGRVYLDQKSDGHESRIRLSDIEDSYTEEELSEMLAPSSTKIYIAKDTNRMYRFYNGAWYDLSGILPHLAELDEENKYVWFGSTDDPTPLYDTDLFYNTAKKTLKVKNTETETVNGLKISTTVNEDGTKIVNFSMN